VDKPGDNSCAGSTEIRGRPAWGGWSTELEVQSDWHPDEHVNGVELRLDFVTRFVRFAFGVLSLTIVVGSLVLIGFAVIVGYTAVLVGNAILVRLTRHELQVA
jgi:hypothetical protein